MLNPIVWLNYAWKIPNKQAFWPFLKHFYVVAKISWSLKLCFNKSFDTYDIFDFILTMCRFGSVVKYWVHYLRCDGSSHPKFYFNLDKFRNSKKNLGLARTFTPQIMNPIHNLWAKSESANLYSMIFYFSNESDKMNFAKAWKCYKKG